MADKLSGIEASAIGLLKQAVELDTARRFTEALVCYREGIQLLLDVCKAVNDEPKKQRYRQRISDYMERAEKLKQHIEEEKEHGKYHEQIHIESNSTGHSYERVFGRFLDEHVTHVEVEDPYIRTIHQVYNFLRFCELLVKSKSPVKSIRLLTGLERDVNAQHQQKSRLTELAGSLHSLGVLLQIDYSETLHDREIRFDTGWIIKIGRGLDYFCPAPSKFSIGYCDLDLRLCHETRVDIFHRKHTKPPLSSS